MPSPERTTQQQAYTWRADTNGRQEVSIQSYPAPQPIMHFFPAAPIYMNAITPLIPISLPPAGMFFTFPAPPPPAAAAGAAVSEAGKGSASSASSSTTTAVPPSSTTASASSASTKTSPNSAKPKAKPKANPEKKEKKKPNPNPTPSQAPGLRYIYPKHHTTIHVIKDVKVWEWASSASCSKNPSAAEACAGLEAQRGRNFVVKTFNVGVCKAVGELIEDLVGDAGEEGGEEGGQGEGEGKKGWAAWALTEVVEKGDGVFGKDITVEYGSGNADKSLAALGWTQARGSARPPVWLVLHRIE